MSTRLVAHEPLERRVLLAGNVSANWDAGAGTLTLTGDGDDNFLTLTADVDGRLVFAGENGTLIDGRSQYVLDAPESAALRHVVYDLQGGNDTVFTAGVVAPQLLSASLLDGEGDDQFAFRNVTLASARISLSAQDGRDLLSAAGGEFGSVAVRGGGQRDQIYVIDSVVRNNVTFDVAAGDELPLSDPGPDLIQITTSEIRHLDGAASRFVTGNGADSLNLFRTTVGAGGAVVIDAGAGNDVAGLTLSAVAGPLEMEGGLGDDILGVAYSTLQAARITDAGGDNRLDVEQSVFEQSLSYVATAGLGNDRVSIAQVAIRGAGGGESLIATGGSNDEVRLFRLSLADSVSRFRIDLGGGDDRLGLTDSWLPTAPLVVGGNAGNDTISFGGSTFGEVTLDDFAGSNVVSIADSTVRFRLLFNQFVTPQGTDDLSLTDTTILGLRGLATAATFGGGRDRLTVSGSTLETSFSFDLGGGNDTGSIASSRLAPGAPGAYLVDLGAGDDAFAFSGNSLGPRSAAIVNGGTGADTLTMTGNTTDAPGGAPPSPLNVEVLNA